ncbi:unnamed protein product, partial [Mesorhabditis spiculigera]
MSHGGGSTSQTVADIYRAVINDVISQMKDSFLDENIDIDVLQTLKQEWEDRVRSDGGVDYDGPKNPVQMVPVQPRTQPARPVQQQQQQHFAPTMRPQAQPSQQYTEAKAQAINQFVNRAPPMAVSMGQPQLLTHNLDHGQPPPQRIPATQPIYMGQPNQQPQQLHHFTQQQGINLQQIPPQFRLVQTNSQPFLIQNGGPGMQQPMPMVLPGQLMGNGRVFLQQQPAQPDQVHQLDGQGDSEDEPDASLPGPSLKRPELKLRSAAALPKPRRIKGKELKQLLKGLKGVVQVDGNGGGMTDSSSGEEEEDDLQRLAEPAEEKEDDDAGADGDDPLNSNDDQSDDEDVVTLFAAEDIIICQFEKVGRARQKWKFNLKDGIMRIKGKDYCFQKCQGEAEW